MNLEKLKEMLSKYGNIEIIKDGYVFTLLMSGTELSNWNVVSAIQSLTLEYAGDKFPKIECMKNEKEFLCLVMRP
jgi:hypothetical protein